MPFGFLKCLVAFAHKVTLGAKLLIMLRVDNSTMYVPAELSGGFDM
jgi:hypothetical protein